MEVCVDIEHAFRYTKREVTNNIEVLRGVVIRLSFLWTNFSNCLFVVH